MVWPYCLLPDRKPKGDSESRMLAPVRWAGTGREMGTDLMGEDRVCEYSI